ncbi:hypothetical protein MBLNU13_g08849t1 [Cladosporium sp. NU13]
MLAYLDVRDENHSEAALFRTFSRWLRDPRHLNWLLIVDSADNEDTLLYVPAEGQTEGRGRPWINYLGSCDHGSILFTTRTRSVAEMIVEKKEDIITVKPMEREHALALLERKLENECTSEKADQLAKELDFMPLAMVHAASYIRHNQRSVEWYIAKLQESSRSLRKLLSRKLKPHEVGPQRDWEANDSIFLTWQISFEHILTTRKSAIDLLSLMSCFDRQAIPKALLGRNDRESDDHVNNITRGYNQKRKTGASDVDDAEGSKDDSTSDSDGGYDSSSTSGSESFHEDITILQHYSFVSETPNKSVYEMHRLVQLATQRWLKSRDSLDHWRSQFITNLDRAFPLGKYDNWTECRELFPHATLALNTKVHGRDALLRQASLLENSGWYALEQGDYGVAEQMRFLSKKSRERFLGADDPATVTSMHNLALTYLKQGKFEQAVDLGEQVVEKRNRSPGPEHPDTLTSVSLLAATYCYLGRLVRGAELQEQVLQARERTLGPRDLDTLTSMNNLSTTYQRQTLYKLAEELGARALEARESILGPEHPDTATSMSNLAITYQLQGRYDEAAELGQRALEMKKKVLRAQHPQVATSMSNLATTYRSLNLYDRASELEEQALELRKSELEPHHPDMLICMSNLATSYRHQKRYEDAAELGEQVLQIRKQMPHPDYTSIANSMGNLASTYRSLKRYAQAIELGREALEIRKRELKLDHPHIATSMRNLALSCRSQALLIEAQSQGLDMESQIQALHKEAAELQDQALRIRHRVLGPRHPHTSISRAELADALHALGCDAEAIERAVRLASPPSE